MVHFISCLSSFIKMRKKHAQSKDEDVMILKHLIRFPKVRTKNVIYLKLRELREQNLGQRLVFRWFSKDTF